MRAFMSDSKGRATFVTSEWWRAENAEAAECEARAILAETEPDSPYAFHARTQESHGGEGAGHALAEALAAFVRED